MTSNTDFTKLRANMVEQQLKARRITDQRVLAAMNAVPRHEFVPPEFREKAYEDSPQPIGKDQTISQPYMVASMTELLALKGGERVLEIGTGCGYQTAILCELAKFVFSLERIGNLAKYAAETLHRLGYQNFEIHVGDGSQGLADMSPYDAILVTAAAPAIPGPLRSQLSPDGGRLVVPVGDRLKQELQVIRRQGNRLIIDPVMAVRFVPLVGAFGFKPSAPR